MLFSGEIERSDAILHSLSAAVACLQRELVSYREWLRVGLLGRQSEVLSLIDTIGAHCEALIANVKIVAHRNDAHRENLKRLERALNGDNKEGDDG